MRITTATCSCEDWPVRLANRLLCVVSSFQPGALLTLCSLGGRGCDTCGPLPRNGGRPCLPSWWPASLLWSSLPTPTRRLQRSRRKMSRRTKQQRLGGPQLLVLQRQVRRGMPGRQRPAAGRRKEPAQGRGRWRRSGRTGARTKRKPGRSLGAQRISRPRRGPKAWNVLHAWQHMPAGNGCVSGPLCRIASASS